MATYDFKPSIYEANGNGSYTYRWNIKEVQVPANVNDPNGAGSTDKQRTQWQCDEVVVWATVSREKLTSAVLASIWPSDYEAKLVNDYNAAKEGVLGETYIQRYKDFLSERKAVKEQIEQDYANFVQ
jgi:hypothetical protein